MAIIYHMYIPNIQPQYKRHAKHWTRQHKLFIIYHQLGLQLAQPTHLQYKPCIKQLNRNILTRIRDAQKRHITIRNTFLNIPMVHPRPHIPAHLRNHQPRPAHQIQFQRPSLHRSFQSPIQPESFAKTTKISSNKLKHLLKLPFQTPDFQR